MVDLQALWPMLSPRERDVLVAKAKGWTVKEFTCGEDHWVDCAPQGTDLAKSRTSLHFIGGKLHYEASPFDVILPEFSADWSVTGHLLEEMLVAGCEIRMQPPTGSNIWVEGHEAVLLVAQKTAATIAATGNCWPGRIALAYVLWKGSAA